MEDKTQTLTRMETEFVFDYLKSKNVPIEISVFEKDFIVKQFKIISSNFDFADSKIFLPNEFFSSFCEKKVRVAFEFKKLPVYFFSSIKKQNEKLFVLKPEQIFSVKSDSEETKNWVFGKISFSKTENEKIELDCFIKDLNILKKNTISLKEKSTELTKNALLEIIFWKKEKLVFLGKTEIQLPRNTEFSLTLKIPLDFKSIFRSISVNFNVENIYSLNEKKYFVAHLYNIKKEDERFLEDFLWN